MCSRVNVRAGFWNGVQGSFEHLQGWQLYGFSDKDLLTWSKLTLALERKCIRIFLNSLGVEWNFHHPGEFFHLQTRQLAHPFFTPTFYKLIIVLVALLCVFSFCKFNFVKDGDKHFNIHIIGMHTPFHSSHGTLPVQKKRTTGIVSACSICEGKIARQIFLSSLNAFSEM